MASPRPPVSTSEACFTLRLPAERCTPQGSREACGAKRQEAEREPAAMHRHAVEAGGQSVPQGQASLVCSCPPGALAEGPDGCITHRCLCARLALMTTPRCACRCWGIQEERKFVLSPPILNASAHESASPGPQDSYSPPASTRAETLETETPARHNRWTLPKRRNDCGVPATARRRS